MSTKFNDYLDPKGIIHHLTIHDMPEYNGTVECLNRTLPKWVRAMLHASRLPRNMWGEAIMHAVYLKNCAYKMLTKMKLNFSNLPEFGTKVWVHNDTSSKLDG